MSQALSTRQVDEFRSQGYLGGLHVFEEAEMDRINAELPSLLELLEPGETTKEIREWHEESQYLFDICMDTRILDYVDCLLGPDFYMWASNFFVKEPHTLETVGWHQDAYYWPLDPVESLTVWVAFDDVDDENGAMQFLPGSHRRGLVNHVRGSDTDSVLSLVADVGDFDTDKAVSIPLLRGSISIHDDKLLHASPANLSDRRRAGFTIRYSPNHVTCDLRINPHFRVYPARGKVGDRNPLGVLPTKRFGRLYRSHQSIEEAGTESEEMYWNADGQNDDRQ